MGAASIAARRRATAREATAGAQTAAGHAKHPRCHAQNAPKVWFGCSNPGSGAMAGIAACAPHGSRLWHGRYCQTYPVCRQVAVLGHALVACSSSHPPDFAAMGTVPMKSGVFLPHVAMYIAGSMGTIAGAPSVCESHAHQRRHDRPWELAHPMAWPEASGSGGDRYLSRHLRSDGTVAQAQQWWVCWAAPGDGLPAVAPAQLLSLTG